MIPINYTIAIYIQLTHAPKIVDITYPIQIYIFKNVHSTTLCPKGTQKPSNLHSSPNCWHVISNTNIYIFNWHMLPKLLSSQSIQIYIFKNVYTPTPETIQLTFIPQVLAWYIQYEQVYSTDIYSPNCWQHISNTNMHFYKCTLPNRVPEAHTEPLWLTFIPQLLAAYIQYN